MDKLMDKLIVSIKGMHCKSCEILIEDELKKIPEIKKIKISAKSGTAEIYYADAAPDKSKIIQAIKTAGYETTEKKEIHTSQFFSKDNNTYFDLAISALVLLIFYLVLRATGLTHLSIGSNNSSLLFVILTGLTAGFSSCMALVGGLILGVSAKFSEKHPAASPIQKFRPHLFFNLGRIVSFFILGGLVGLIGKALRFSSPTLGLLTILIGIVMLIIGLQLCEIFPWIRNIFTLPKFLTTVFKLKERKEQEYNHFNALILGGLTFFLPCGFTQAMQLLAISSGSFLTGGLIMALFAIGTVPGLLTIGGLTSIVKGSFAKKFFKFAGLVVIVFAIINFTNGYNLLGWHFLKSSQSPTSSQTVPVEDGFQVARMVQDERGYKPNNFTIKKDVPVKWIIESKSAQTCASALVSSQLNVDQFLKLGENVIEFTPKNTGEVKFSCSMGMYRGSFKVVN